VGRKFDSLISRLKQHVSIRPEKGSTYGMYLGSFAKFVGEDIELELITFSFNTELDKKNQNIVIAALEAMLHLELQPLIGSSR
jgi:hypothetical protein